MNTYNLCETINFTYNSKDVWATILKFGKDFVTCITKDGYRSYKWNKMSPPVVYSCRISDLIQLYEYYKDNRFEYLYRYYGPSTPTIRWKED